MYAPLASVAYTLKITRLYTPRMQVRQAFISFAYLESEVQENYNKILLLSVFELKEKVVFFFFFKEKRKQTPKLQCKFN